MSDEPESRQRVRSPIQRNLVLAALGAILLLLIGIAALGGGGDALPIDVYLALLLAAFLVYGLAVLLIVHRPTLRGIARWLLVVAVLCRVLVLAGPHRYNSDVYRYLWDGDLVARGMNPYAAAPDDPTLDHVRTASPFYAGMNPDYNGIRTVYGPVAMAVFALCARVPGDSVWAVRCTMTAADILTILLLVRMLRALRLPEAYVLVYALNPLLTDSFAQRGQMDALMLPFLVLTVLALVKGRPLASGAALGTAILVKIVPVVLIPVVAVGVFRRGGSVRRFVAGIALVCAAGCAPFVGAGWGALSGLATYAASWHANASLADILGILFGPWAQGVSLVLLAAVVFALVRAGGDENDGARVPRAMAWTLLAVLLLAPAVFPWYLTWTLPFVPILLASARRSVLPWVLLVWSGTAPLWYMRFLVYTPVDEVQWTWLADALSQAAEWIPEPWRVVEYGAVFLVLGIGAVQYARSLNHPKRGPCSASCVPSSR
ncbi:MAG: DUF2029 domain-containing protein [bacterium]|nr:DUF2029 domain-containing protein [bacterium]